MNKIILITVLISIVFIIVGLVGQWITRIHPYQTQASPIYPEPLTKNQKNDIINLVTEIMLVQRVDTIDQKIYRQIYYDHQACYNATYQYYIAFQNQLKPYS